jgi:NAD(P)-dependent dehydrogenase (short-subunit alcohol dehydrogenase family)
MQLELNDKRALVTGGSRGIGLATALALTREGSRVAIAARDRAALDQAARDIEGATGRAPFIVQADCTRADDVAEMVESVGAALGGLDILVNSVGAAHGGHFLELVSGRATSSSGLRSAATPHRHATQPPRIISALPSR